ncbi:HI0074 family nucleotidyltransferase substrate-binding subunit [Acidithiobacillus sp. IBUN Pt1247-S3]|uniref:HI0074 family nucleotidyltransferase substrate-binding subunit n=1 Tax=Acidithiobacillus sp. IBUN Pt1247-S3 TaxID=3166642 RepID=UPI0034E5CF6C
MSEISLDALYMAVQAVDDALSDYRYAEETQSRLLLSVRDGAIQRFESAMDLSRKLILRVLKEKFALDDITANNKTFIREAARFGLIADAEAWMRHLAARNQTSHAYDAQLAAQVFEKIPAFLPDARDLLVRLNDAIA